ncbi:hypothetical protein GCM10022393_17670 [Aquimarina addita]|uniref:Uncharacterized protein n=1 Tax=Aquimarina addita TaxID=870485 RepID=A0ABP6UGW4_9FLAO
MYEGMAEAIIISGILGKTEIETVRNISLLYIKYQKYNFLLLNKIKRKGIGKFY